MLDSLHASIDFWTNSPAFEDLELETKYGYRIRFVAVPDDTALVETVLKPIHGVEGIRPTETHVVEPV